MLPGPDDGAGRELREKLILPQIAAADLVLGEISLVNINVWFELGVAAAFEKPTVLLVPSSITPKTACGGQLVYASYQDKDHLCEMIAVEVQRKKEGSASRSAPPDTTPQESKNWMVVGADDPLYDPVVGRLQLLAEKEGHELSRAKGRSRQATYQFNRNASSTVGHSIFIFDDQLEKNIEVAYVAGLVAGNLYRLSPDVSLRDRMLALVPRGTSRPADLSDLIVEYDALDLVDEYVLAWLRDHGSKKPPNEFPWPAKMEDRETESLPTSSAKRARTFWVAFTFVVVLIVVGVVLWRQMQGGSQVNLRVAYPRGFLENSVQEPIFVEPIDEHSQPAGDRKKVAVLDRETLEATISPLQWKAGSFQLRHQGEKFPHAIIRLPAQPCSSIECTMDEQLIAETSISLSDSTIYSENCECTKR